ncbi:type IV secretion system DNA-binding domain-containing protein [Glycomyces luteolus]|uniref:Type IV secretion system DNA-binding domain-containing protein n=1 Tax=Glycomyces luteolus TaxID=2670330 RepID=A0A9X3SRC1_9ACTN|nr:type IV secretion system DNA-binding domain-containing protein [Glycomyces luteolus]MDA1359804.1 type IV secretion system DNA-binding domain-containing protein [Glycomyces luteolus]
MAILRASARRSSAAAWREGARYVRIEAPPEVDAKAAVLAWKHLSAIEHGRWRRWWSGQPHLIFEYCFVGQRLTVRIWVPGTVATSQVTHAVDAAWPGAVCTVVEAQPPLPVGERVRIEGGTFTLAKRGVGALPLVAGIEAGEVLRGLVAAGTSNRADDVRIMQVVAAPPSRRQVRLAAKAAAGPKSSGSLLGEVLDLFTPGAGHHKSGRPMPEPAWIAQHRKLVAERLASGTLWSMRVRYAVATTAGRPHAVAAARDLAAGTAGVLGGAWRRRKAPRIAAAVNAWSGGPGVLVSAAELAAVAHVPADAVMPALARAGARPIAPAPEVPSGGRGTKTLGVAALSGRKIALAAADGRYHAHLIGATGSGKSTLMVNMILQDIRDKRAVVVLDPHGDLVRDVLDRLDPATVAGRVVLIDPASDAPPPGLPPVLRAPDAEIAIDYLVGIWRQLWPDHWGPRADDIARQALRTQAQLQQRDLAGLSALPIILADKAERAPLVTNIKDDTVLRGFWNWFDALPIGVQTQASGPVLSRLRTLLSRKFIRDTIGDPLEEYCINLPRALDNGGIILARLPKGELGNDASKFLGSNIAAQVWQAVLPRQSQRMEDRKDCVLYADEGHNWLQFPQILSDMFAEARKLKLSFVFAHQHLGQLPKELAETLDANARTKIIFSTSPRDAKVLAAHTLPHLDDHDLVHLGAYTAACRTIAAGAPLPAFTLQTLPPPEAVGEAETIRAGAARHRAFTWEP